MLRVVAVSTMAQLTKVPQAQVQKWDEIDNVRLHGSKENIFTAYRLLTVDLFTSNT